MTLILTWRASAEEPRPLPLSSSQLEIIDGTPDLGVTSYWTDAEGNVVFSPNTPEEKMRTPVTKTQRQKGEKIDQRNKICFSFLRYNCAQMAVRLQSLWLERQLCMRLKTAGSRKGRRRNQEQWRQRNKTTGRRHFLPTNQSPQRNRPPTLHFADQPNLNVLLFLFFLLLVCFEFLPTVCLSIEPR